VSEELKDRHKAIRERLLDLTAQGLTRRDAAERCGLNYRTARAIIEKARAANDPRAEKRQGGKQRGHVLGVPHDLVADFKAAASKRQMRTNELRRRVLAIVTRDNLFDALDLDSLTEESLRQ
jgi:molybdenum-dependent DNA-binding transcriptional regulator ModE